MDNETQTPEVVNETESQTLFPVPQMVRVEDEDGNVKVYKVPPFKFGKTLLMVELLTEVLEGNQVADLLNGGDTNLVIRLLSDKLPTVIRSARPVLLRAVALTLMDAKEVASIEATGDIRAELLTRGANFGSEMDVEQLFDTLVLGIRAMGLETIKKNLPKLLAAINGRS